MVVRGRQVQTGETEGLQRHSAGAGVVVRAVRSAAEMWAATAATAEPGRIRSMYSRPRLFGQAFLVVLVGVVAVGMHPDRPGMGRPGMARRVHLAYPRLSHLWGLAPGAQEGRARTGPAEMGARGAPVETAAAQPGLLCLLRRRLPIRAP